MYVYVDANGLRCKLSHIYGGISVINEWTMISFGLVARVWVFIAIMIRSIISNRGIRQKNVVYIRIIID